MTKRKRDYCILQRIRNALTSVLIAPAILFLASFGVQAGSLSEKQYKQLEEESVKNGWPIILEPDFTYHPESEDDWDDPFMESTFYLMQAMFFSLAIMEQGFSCNTVSAINRANDKEFTVTCNEGRYRFGILDYGGKFLVWVKE